MPFSSTLFSLFRGLLFNLLITVGSCIIPIIVGFLIYMSCNNQGRIPSWVKVFGLFFESFCPIVTLCLLYYAVFSRFRGFNSVLTCILIFTICFLGYMPKRYSLDLSFKKNFIVNTIGLLSYAFKWSFCITVIAVYDMLARARQSLALRADCLSFGIAFIISFVIIFILESMKCMTKENL